MASERHKRQLKEYLARNKNIASSIQKISSPSSVVTKTQSLEKTHKTAGCRVAEVGARVAADKIRSEVQLHVQSSKNNGKRKATIEHLPDEVVLKIFSHLDIQSLLQASCVCKQWCSLANDNLVWHKIFQKYVGKVEKQHVTADDTVVKLPSSYWKKLCLSRSMEKRNKRTLQLLKKINCCGIPAQSADVLRQNGVTYQLSLVDTLNVEHCFDASDMFWHHMSVCVRWYNLNFLPLKHVHRICILAQCPLFFGADGRPVPGSPYQRSLIWKTDIRLDEWCKQNEPLASDDLFTLYKLPEDLLLATWKADREIGFMAAGFHLHQLVPRSLLGTSSQPYKVAKHKVKLDDIDPTYGLHGYQANLVLRNMRNELWSQHFRNIFCRMEDVTSGCARFTLVQHDSVADHSPLTRKLNMPWKTELFKGVIEFMAWLDITVLDEHGAVFYASSAPVQAQKLKSSSGSDFEYNDESALVIMYPGERVSVQLKLGKIADDKIYVRHILLDINLSTINDWFGTKY